MTRYVKLTPIETGHEASADDCVWLTGDYPQILAPVTVLKFPERNIILCVEFMTATYRHDCHEENPV